MNFFRTLTLNGWSTTESWSLATCKIVASKILGRHKLRKLRKLTNVTDTSFASPNGQNSVKLIWSLDAVLSKSWSCPLVTIFEVYTCQFFNNFYGIFDFTFKWRIKLLIDSWKNFEMQSSIIFKLILKVLSIEKSRVPNAPFLILNFCNFSESKSKMVKFTVSQFSKKVTKPFNK